MNGNELYLFNLSHSFELALNHALNYNGAGISRRGAEKIIEKYRAVSGITKRFSCHSLRHTFGSYKSTQGVSPFQLKEWMGHSSISTTQIYVHMGQEGAKKAMEATSL